MASPLASIAKTIAGAAGFLFFDAVLTRDGTSYTCKAINNGDGGRARPSGVSLGSTQQLIVLAATLSVKPQVCDQITLQGQTFTVVSDNEGSKAGVTTDPATAVWTLRCQPPGFYPRTVSIRRQAGSATVGVGAYQGMQKALESTLYSGLPAAIIEASTGRYPDPGLPSDARSTVDYYVFLAPDVLPLGAVKTHDIVVDEIGSRYQVSSPYWNTFGYRLRASLLEP